MTIRLGLAGVGVAAGGAGVLLVQRGATDDLRLVLSVIIGIVVVGILVLTSGWPWLSRRLRTAAALDRALVELESAHAELGRRQSFIDAMLETVDVGIVSCDANGVFVVSNRAEREMFSLQEGLEGLVSEDLAELIVVADPSGRPLTADEYPIERTLRGEDVSQVDVLVGPPTGAQREVVVRGSQIRGPRGELLGAVAALTDVTAERTALRALAEERHRLAEAQLLGQLGGFDHDLTTGMWTFSDQLCALWGVQPGTANAQQLLSLVVDEDRAGVLEQWATTAQVAGHHGDEFRIRRSDDGSERVIRSRTEVELDADGRPVRVRGTHLDVTDLAVATQQAQSARAFSDAVLAASPDTTVVTDLATRTLVYVSPGSNLLGLAADQLAALTSEEIADLVHPEDNAVAGALDAFAASLDDGQSHQRRFRARDIQGRWRWLSRTVTPFRRDSAGTVVEVLSVLRDVTDLTEAEQRLTHAARHDNLTGLPNRALLTETLEALLERSRADGREVAVLFCDLDGFKEVNDTGGHSAGDAVLQETSRRLRSVISAPDMVARVGGDEFVVVVAPSRRTGPDVLPPTPEDTRAAAVAVAERVTAALRLPITVLGLDHIVTASIGITYSRLESGGLSGAAAVDAMLHRADAAMYRAKDSGRDRYETDEITTPAAAGAAHVPDSPDRHADPVPIGAATHPPDDGAS